ncbi:MAG: TRAP transporter small permease subunit [Myxococcales bacterium]|nr:TRAP transporter small permease subunit [Myxococcales bacterium]
MQAHERKLGHHPPPDFPIALRGIAAVSRLLAVLEGIGIGVCLTSLVALAVYQFAARNLNMHHITFLPPAPDWADGVIRHSVFLLGFLGAAYATYTARHIRIDAVTRMAPPMGRLILRILTTLAALALLYFLVRASLGFYRVCLEEEGEASMKHEIFTSSRGAIVIIAGFCLIAFHFFVQLILDSVWVIRRQPPPADWIAEATHGGDAAADETPALATSPEGAQS